MDSNKSRREEFFAIINDNSISDERFTDCNTFCEFVDKCVRVCYSHSDGYKTLLGILFHLQKSFYSYLNSWDEPSECVISESEIMEETIFYLNSFEQGFPDNLPCLLWDHHKWLICYGMSLILREIPKDEHEMNIADFTTLVEYAVVAELNALHSRLFPSENSRAMRRSHEKV